MVSGDTGPTHVAAAVGTPLVALFGPTRPQRNGPWSPDDVAVSRASVCQCHHLRRCALASMCLLDVQVDEVLSAIDRRLALALPVVDSPSSFGVASVLSRWRVTLGFVCGAIVLWLAQPTARTLVAGVSLAAAGEALRVWAAGHLNKSREVTSSGPYRWFAHPLYVGSSVMGAGLAIAAGDILVALLVAVYLVTTLTAAIRNEESFLRRTFGDRYEGYLRGSAPSGTNERRFAFSQAIANGEHRAIAGLLIAVLLLVLKARSG